MRIVRIFLFVFVSTFALAGLARAQEALDTGTPLAGNRDLVKYDPETKSYFEWRHLGSTAYGHGQGPNWSEARDIAASSRYHGVAGRLAIVRNVDTHEFLLKNFNPPGEAWIGLQYMCGSRQSVWIDGTVLGKADFAAWDLSQWYRNDNITCTTAHIPWMGVYYLPRNQFFRWQATGSAKRFRDLIIEYPTGKP